MSESLRQTIINLHYDRWFIPSSNYEKVLNDKTINSDTAIYLGKSLTKEYKDIQTYLYKNKLTYKII